MESGINMDHRKRPDPGGGALLDARVYLISMTSMIFAPPGSILAVGN